MEDYIGDQEVDGLLQKLHQLHDELEQERESLEHEAKPVQLDQQAFGRVSRGEALQQQNMAKAALGQCEQRLQQISEALRKIDSEEYGYCESCGERISSARLNAKPESELCLDCQAQEEQA